MKPVHTCSLIDDPIRAPFTEERTKQPESPSLQVGREPYISIRVCRIPKWWPSSQEEPRPKGNQREALWAPRLGVAAADKGTGV